MGMIDLDLSGLATELLSSDNPTVFLQVASGGIVDDDGVYTPAQVVDVALNAAKKDVTNDMIDGTVIQQGDIIITCDNKIQPHLGDKVKVDGELYTICNPVTAKRPASVTQVYEFVARK